MVSRRSSAESRAERGHLGRTDWLLCLTLALTTVALYERCLSNDFINFDDRTYINENGHLRSGVTLETVHWAFTTYSAGNWHPLTWLSHALDVQVFGLNPTGHHAVNVLLHALNAVLVFLLLSRATGAQMRSLLAAALFALHPLNVECDPKLRTSEFTDC
jgi:protein O-mannosyl-transferase